MPKNIFIPQNPMTHSPQNQHLINLGKWISPRLPHYESILVVAIVFGLILKMTTDLPIDVVNVLLLSALATIYIFKAYSISDDENIGAFERFIDKLASLGSGVAVVGILFMIQNWNGYAPLVMCGCGTSIVSLILIIISRSQKPELNIFGIRLMIRLFLIALVGIALYLTPKEEFVKVGLHKGVKVEVAIGK